VKFLLLVLFLHTCHSAEDHPAECKCDGSYDNCKAHFKKALDIFAACDSIIIALASKGVTDQFVTNANQNLRVTSVKVYKEPTSEFVPIKELLGAATPTHWYATLEVATQATSVFERAEKVSIRPLAALQAAYAGYYVEPQPPIGEHTFANGAGPTLEAIKLWASEEGKIGYNGQSSYCQTTILKFAHEFTPTIEGTLTAHLQTYAAVKKLLQDTNTLCNFFPTANGSWILGVFAVAGCSQGGGCCAGGCKALEALDNLEADLSVLLE